MRKFEHLMPSSFNTSVLASVSRTYISPIPIAVGYYIIHIIHVLERAKDRPATLAEPERPLPALPLPPPERRRSTTSTGPEASGSQCDSTPCGLRPRLTALPAQSLSAQSMPLAT